MSSPSAQCPSCHKPFPWKAALVGRKIKCTCGQVFAFPDAPLQPAASAGLAAGDFEAHDAGPAKPLPDVKCPSCNLPMKAAAVVCLNCGYNTQQGGKLKTQVVAAGAAEPVAARQSPHSEVRVPDPTKSAGPSAIATALAQREDDSGVRPFRDHILPWIFIVEGIALSIWSFLHVGESPVSALVHILAYLLIYVPVLLGALTLAARLMDITYGSLFLGLFKLTAVALGPLALADFILALIMGATLGTGIYLSLPVYAIVLGIPISLMFDLEAYETLITLVIIIIVRMFFNWALDILLTGFFG